MNKEETIMCCINCGRTFRQDNKNSSDFVICPDCSNAYKELQNILDKGITLEYKDGTRKTINVPKRK